MTTSQTYFDKAKALIPGGVNSPVRAFSSVGGEPLYIDHGTGAYITDVDGKAYLDFCGSWGPLVLGHAHPAVVETVQQAAAKGLSFGTCNAAEVEMAELLTEAIPAMERVRLVNSGTEATMTALRLARGVTGRQKILKFDGCYHGHSDSLLVSAGSGLLTGGISSSAGVGDSAVADTLVCPFNDSEAVQQIFEQSGKEIAAVIVEPVAGNMGLVKPVDGFLKNLRDATQDAGAILIFDEVITGFRLGATTYGELVGIKPDLTCLGKIIGGGMPIGAVGGRKEIMAELAPLGPVYQAGTLSGNPVALAAGLATLRTLQQQNPYPAMADLASGLTDKVNEFAAKRELALHAEALGGMFTIFFTDKKQLLNLEDVKQCDTGRFAAYHQKMLQQGVYLSPSQFELGFVSASHTQADIDKFIAAFKASV